MLFNDKRFFDIPKTLETPETHEIMQDYARNMEVIKGLINDENKKVLQIT
jgi:endonuclease IV